MIANIMKSCKKLGRGGEGRGGEGREGGEGGGGGVSPHVQPQKTSKNWIIKMQTNVKIEDPPRFSYSPKPSPSPFKNI